MNIIVVGNVVVGLVFHGPFEDENEANKYADNFLRGEDWVVTRVERVDR